MFEESLVESTALLQTRSRWPAILSFTAQAVIVAVIIAVPMFYPELLPMHARSFALTPPPPPPPPPIPPHMQHVRAMLAAAEAPTAPSAPAPQRSLIRSLVNTALVTAETPLSGFVGNGMGDTSTSTLANTFGPGTGPSVTAVPSAAPAPAHTGPVKLSSGVTAGLLINPIQPVYPPIAKATRQQGAVVVRAIISRTGQIERAQVISGPALLQSAALEAVEHARYRPFLLNGQPTEVETTVTINFTMGS